MLCLATNIAQSASDSIVPADTLGLNMEAMDLELDDAFAISLCCFPLTWVVTSLRPPWDIVKSEQHSVHLAYVLPLRNDL